MYIGGSALGFTIPAPLYAATPSHASRQAGSRIVVQGKVGQRHVRMLTADRTGWLFCRVALTVKICQSDVPKLVIRECTSHRAGCEAPSRTLVIRKVGGSGLYVYRGERPGIHNPSPPICCDPKPCQQAGRVPHSGAGGKVGQRHVRMLTADRTGWLFCRVALTVKICQSDVTRLVQQGNNAVTEAENAAQSGCRHLV